MPVEFKDFSISVKSEMQDAAVKWLIEAAGELESQTKRNTRVDTGQTKGTWRYVVDEGKLEARVGSEKENAIWEEFGTGEYALKGNGKKTPWYVPVEGYTGKKKPTFNGKVIIVHGKNGKDFYKTNGKKPNRALWNAYNTKKAALIKRAEIIFRGMKT